ncbi:MAG: DUF6702 family protein [Longimicrobiales bacterium]
MRILPALLVLLPAVPAGGPPEIGSGPAAATSLRTGPSPVSMVVEAPPHDLHATYGNLGVEGAVAILQIRIFQDDLEEALRRFHGRESLRLEVTPEVDGLFLAYLGRRFVLETGGAPLEGRIVGSGDDALDREPVWWYQVQYRAPEPIRTARITNTILFEIFDDQSNVLRVVRFPEETRRAYYFTSGEETVEIEF